MMLFVRAGAAAILVVAGLLAQGLAAGEGRLAYPLARRGECVDDYFGTKVADPYRWLEDDIRGSAEVARWVAAENKLTASYLDAIPQRQAIRGRLTELWNFAQYSPPSKHGGKYYYAKHDGVQNHPIVYVADALDGPPRVLLDPNTWSKDGTVALTGMSFSEDGKYLAYARSEAGSDWSTWRVMDLSGGEGDRHIFGPGRQPKAGRAENEPVPRAKTLSDELRWIKFSTVAWTKDDKGFFYTRYEQPARGTEYQASNLNNRLCYHRLGTPQAADVLVYWRPEHPEWLYGAEVTEDGRWLVISINPGKGHNNRVLVRDLSEPYAMPVALVGNFEHRYDFVGNDGRTFFFLTDQGAPRGRLVAVDLDAAARRASASSRPQKTDESEGASSDPDLRDIIPQSEATLARVSFVGNRFIACYLKDVVSQVKVFSIDGKPLGEIAMPGVGAAAGFGGKRTDNETFYGFSSITTPPSVYRYDLSAGSSRLWRRAEVKFNPQDYETKQVFYHSKDGTRIPMFIAHKKGITLNGDNPTLLYGYGGFNISLLPAFSVGRIAWMEMGGVYAQPNLRGGGEYGEAWHAAGTKLDKQNVFDDFIAAAEWLIREKYTRPKRLAIEGGSNGGLLVGAVMTQRPELFAACLPAVGVMDMLRFHKFTEGRTWVDDYGSSDNPRQFKALLAYSPYHNIRPGTCYPATLVSTADTDDRVIPGHSFKFTAALQAAQGCNAPVLILVSTRAGHGGGKPQAKRIAEIADHWAFLVKALGMKGPPSEPGSTGP
jgi:prolyl oligopeptidase